MCQLSLTWLSLYAAPTRPHPATPQVVVLGQDPYHGPGQAVGLCFSVPPDAKRPSSLLNIYKELASDCGCRIVPHGNLEEWAAQGERPGLQ